MTQMGSSVHWTTPELTKEQKEWQIFKENHKARRLCFHKREGFLIHRGKCARRFSPINFDDLCVCMSVSVCVCMWAMIPRFTFIFSSVKSDCDCSVKWLSSVLSDIHTNVFPLFHLQGPLRSLRCKRKGCLFHTLIDRGWSWMEEAKHRPYFGSAYGSQPTGDKIF